MELCMNRLLPALLAMILSLLIGAVMILWVQHQSQEKLQAEITALAEQNTRLQADAEDFSNRLAHAGNSPTMSREQFNELLKLRGEVGVLRKQVAQVVTLRAENQQLRAQPPAAPAQTGVSEITPEDLFYIHQMHTVNALKQIALAMRIYAGDNNSQFATNFNQLTNELGHTTNFAGNISLDAFEFVNIGMVNDNTPGMMMFRERSPRQNPNGSWSRVYGLADGSVQTRSSEDGNFDKVDQEYSPPNQPAAN